MFAHALRVLQHPLRDLCGPFERHSCTGDALWLIRTGRPLPWQLLPSHSCAQSELEPLILRGTLLLQSAENARKPFRGDGATARCGLVPGIATRIPILTEPPSDSLREQLLARVLPWIDTDCGRHRIEEHARLSRTPADWKQRQRQQVARLIHDLLLGERRRHASSPS